MGGAKDMTAVVCGGVLSKEELGGTTALVVLYKEPDINWWLKYKRLPNKYLIIPPSPCCFWRNVANPVKLAKRNPFADVHYVSPQWIGDVV